MTNLTPNSSPTPSSNLTPSTEPSPDVFPDLSPNVSPDVPIEPLQPQVQPAQISEPSRRLPSWRLWVPLLFQAILIVAVPARDAYTYATGKPITLQTAPVDPYDLLRGYYQTLSYDISSPDVLRSLPGGEWFNRPQGQSGQFYVVLEAPAQSDAVPPQPWQPVRVSGDRPTDLASNQIALQGDYNGWAITYGLESYYLPEDQRDAINADISQVQMQEREAFVVDVKVDAGGNAVPVGLWVRDRNYQF